MYINQGLNIRSYSGSLTAQKLTEHVKVWFRIVNVVCFLSDGNKLKNKYVNIFKMSYKTHCIQCMYMQACRMADDDNNLQGYIDVAT